MTAAAISVGHHDQSNCQVPAGLGTVTYRLRCGMTLLAESTYVNVFCAVKIIFNVRRSVTEPDRYSCDWPKMT